jgi:hypothetical protein
METKLTGETRLPVSLKRQALKGYSVPASFASTAVWRLFLAEDDSRFG